MTDEAKELLREIGDVPISVVSIIGVERNGKSFLLNHLCRESSSISDSSIFDSSSMSMSNAKAKSSDQFAVASSAKGVTKGLWLSVANDLSQPNHVTLAIDSEGVGSTDSEGKDDVQTQDHQIMCMSILLSSLLIYNIRSALDASGLEVLDLVTSITTMVSAGSVEQADASKEERKKIDQQAKQLTKSMNKLDDDEDSVTIEMHKEQLSKKVEERDAIDAREMNLLSSHLPHLIVSIRDFGLSLFDVHRELALSADVKATGTDYLTWKLRPEPITKGVRIPRFNRLKQRITTLFPHRACFVIPHPGRDNAHEARLEQLRPEFIDEIRQLKNQVRMDTRITKSIKNTQGHSIVLTATGN